MINGAYLLREGLFNGSPQYQKEDDKDEWLVKHENRVWVVITKLKEAFKSECYSEDKIDEAYFSFSVDIGLPLPHMAKEWKVFDGSALIIQPEVAVSALVTLFPL